MKHIWLLSSLFTTSFCFATPNMQPTEGSPLTEVGDISASTHSETSPSAASQSYVKDGFYGSTAIGLGFFQARHIFYAPIKLAQDNPLRSPSMLENGELDTSGPRATLDIAINFSSWFRLHLKGALGDLYCRSSSLHFQQPKGYIADGDAELLFPWCISSKSKFYLATMIGFGWHQFHINSKQYQTHSATLHLQYFLRTLSPKVGLFFEIQPSQRSFSSFGISFFFPRGKQRLNIGSVEGVITDQLRAARHGISFEYMYRYKVSKRFSLFAQMQVQELSIQGNSYHKDNEINDPILPSVVTERLFLGTVGFNFSY